MSLLNRVTPMTTFPSFLLPSVPFRRRKTSTDSTSTTASSLSATPEDADRGPSDLTLDGHVSYLRCSRCSVDLCLTSAIVSRGFTGRWGRAYLVSATSSINGELIAQPTEPSVLPNIHIHRPVPRQLVTGGHTVSDVSCDFCGNVLGWKYVAADEESQQYKVGKFILETQRVSVTADWEQGGERTGLRNSSTEDPRAVEAVEFDSQDEEECEDLFAGVWTPELAMRRRRTKRSKRDVR